MMPKRNRFEYLSVLVITLIVLIGEIPHAFADCTLISTGQTKPAGYFFYNADFKVMEYCDGANWRMMMGGGIADPALSNLTDVDDALAPVDGNVLTYDSASGEWRAGTAGIGVEVDPEVGTLTTGKWCVTNAAGTAVDCTANAPVTSEVDPKISTLTGSKWCVANVGGSAIDCTANAPVTFETDPEVGATTNGQWCRGSGTAVECDQAAPSFSETDPEVGTLTGSKWCASNAGGTAIDCTANAPVTAEADPQIGTLTAAGRICASNAGNTAVDCSIAEGAGGGLDADTLDGLSSGAFVQTETDPQVGTLTTTKWCVTNAGGTAIDCTANAPVTVETDPQVGTTTSGYGCYGTGSAATCADSAFLWDATNHRLGIGLAPSYALDVSGTVRATAYLYASDARLKTDIATLDGLALVSKLRGVSYTWKATGKPATGVIAQEVEQVLPDAVSTDDQGMKAVDYQQLIGPLIEAVKTLKAENNDLRARVEKLEAGAGDDR
jgi:hypothetical protein